jgi:hypothetical protein
MRGFVLTLAMLAGAYAGLGLAVRVVCPACEGLERAACRVGVCADDVVAERAYALLLAGGEAGAGAVERFRMLAARNPGSPYGWATLAEALAETGNAQGARAAIGEAIERGPALPQIRLRAAHVFSELGDRDGAARSLAAVLRNTAAFDGVVFEEFRRGGYTVAEVAAPLDGNRRAAQAWFGEVRARCREEEVRVAWEWLLRRGYADERLAAGYSGWRFGGGQ